MKKIPLGSTGLFVSKTAMGCLPIQRRSAEDAAAILRAAYEGGVNYFDTANSYTDSEEKIGRALSHRRGEFFLATKTHSKTAADFEKDLETSLRLLNTDHIDVYQFHNPPFVPVPGGAVRQVSSFAASAAFSSLKGKWLVADSGQPTADSAGARCVLPV